MRIIAASVLLLAAAGCSRHQRQIEEPEAAPDGDGGGAEAEPVPQDPREDPEARGAEREPDPSDTPVQACAAYQACCTAYMMSLSQVEGMTPDAIETALEGCAAIGALVATESADKACATALDAMRQAVDAMKSVPGYVPPAACQ